MLREEREYNLFDELNDRLADLEHGPTSPGVALLTGLWGLTGEELEFTIFDARETPRPEPKLLIREYGRAA